MNNSAKKPLLQLIQGAILDFREDKWSRRGCETCDYGSSYVQDFSVVTTDGTYRFEFDAMYEYAVSHEFLFKTILPNAQMISIMTIPQFIGWLTEQFQAVVADAGSIQPPKFTYRKEDV